MLRKPNQNQTEAEAAGEKVKRRSVSSNTGVVVVPSSPSAPQGALSTSESADAASAGPVSADVSAAAAADKGMRSQFYS